MPRYSPPPPRGFDRAIEHLLGALAEADMRATRPAPRPPLPEPTGLDAALVEGVRNNDAAAVQAALKAGANANVNQGLPLQLAASSRNFSIVKELVIRGADVPVAVASLYAEKSALQPATSQLSAKDPAVRQALLSLITAINPRASHVGDAELAALMTELNRQRGSLVPANATNARRCQQIDATITALNDWQTRFLKDIAPIEILRQQRRILDEIEDMKRDMAPQKLDKPKLSLPKPPQQG